MTTFVIPIERFIWYSPENAAMEEKSSARARAHNFYVQQAIEDGVDERFAFLVAQCYLNQFDQDYIQ